MNKATEQLAWSAGILAAEDTLFFTRERLEDHGDPQAFLRGCIEGSGKIALNRAYLKGRLVDKPHVYWAGSPEWHRMLLDRYALLDPRFKAVNPHLYGSRQLSGRIHIRGKHAQRIVQRLWPRADVVTFRRSAEAAEKIKDWLASQFSGFQYGDEPSLVDAVLLVG